jgi:acyl carrier protein
MGSGRVVDSIGLVTLIVDVENRVAEETGQSVSLMDDRAMSQTRSPFRTVGSLAEYVTELTRESREIQP